MFTIGHNMFGVLDWRYVYWSSLGLRFFFALSDSYIHPDEHFQTFEVLTNKFLGFSTNIPWEYSQIPARSFGPLYLVYGPLLWFISYFEIPIKPIQILYLFKLQFCILSWIVSDWALYRLLPTKPERVKALFFTATSYITLVYQSHCFSNSIETLVLLVCLVIIDRVRGSLEMKIQDPHYKDLFLFGVLASIGLFNRVTFPAFLLLPGWFLLKHFWKYKLTIFPAIFGFSIPSILFVLIDTHEFAAVSSSEYVITPLNNLLYNVNKSNLELHGLHPFYTHILINLPQILGPGLVFILYKNGYKTTIPFLAASSGLIVLSIIPHQELRFLVPILPLYASCFDLRQVKASLVPSIINIWYLFNIAMSVLMGIFHQGGVVPVLAHLQEENLHDTIQIWWRTYTPPVWLLGETESLEIMTYDHYDPIHLKSHQGNILLDLMGSPFENAMRALTDLQDSNKEIVLILPTSSYLTNNFSQFSLNKTYEYQYHLDLDHLDVSNLQSFQPGLSIYHLL